MVRGPYCKACQRFLREGEFYFDTEAGIVHSVGLAPYNGPWSEEYHLVPLAGVIIDRSDLSVSVDYSID